MQTPAERKSASEIARSWSDEQGRMVEALVGKYGEPDILGETMLVWNQRGRWKRIVATEDAFLHDFPFSHEDFIECETAYRVPVDKVEDLARFDGSIVVRRTDGTIAAKCHDEESNYLSVNLAHDIITGSKTVDEARRAYVDIMIDYRAKRPTPYFDALQFPEQHDTGDKDFEVITPHEMRLAAERR